MMVVWGGNNGIDVLNTGGRYNPVTDAWTATTTTNAPQATMWHTAVWTGTEMIVWGGGISFGVSTGGRYNPATDSWTATANTNAPSARTRHSAVWTGTEMIIWGGYDGPEFFNTGGIYNPAADDWTAISTINAPEARGNQRAVWTGTDMIVWGGAYADATGAYYLNSGGVYFP
jgi:N-acetylneuraminic acid mutarotase